jgi:hypothetical protein
MLRSYVFPTGGTDPEPLSEDGEERVGLHRADSGEVEQAALELRAGLGVVPNTRCVATVLAHDCGTQVLRPLRHRAGEAVESRTLAEDAVELPRIHAGDLDSAEKAKAPLELEGARERFLHRNLLVEDEPDEEGERLLGEEGVGLVVAREVEPVRPGRSHETDSNPPEFFAERRPTRAPGLTTLIAGGGMGCIPIRSPLLTPLAAR